MFDRLHLDHGGINVELKWSANNCQLQCLQFATHLQFCWTCHGLCQDILLELFILFFGEILIHVSWKASLFGGHVEDTTKSLFVHHHHPLPCHIQARNPLGVDCVNTWLFKLRLVGRQVLYPTNCCTKKCITARYMSNVAQPDLLFVSYGRVRKWWNERGFCRIWPLCPEMATDWTNVSRSLGFFFLLGFLFWPAIADPSRLAVHPIYTTPGSSLANCTLIEQPTRYFLKREQSRPTKHKASQIIG